MNTIQKLAKLALDHPELRGDLMPIIRQHEAAGLATKTITGPPTTEIYEKKIDHGYEEPLAGGTDVMKRLQNQFLIEQGRKPRPTNPKLATPESPQLTASTRLQAGLIELLNSSVGRKVAVNVVVKYAADTETTVVVNGAAEEIIYEAVAVALDPRRMGSIIARHTVEGE